MFSWGSGVSDMSWQKVFAGGDKSRDFSSLPVVKDEEKGSKRKWTDETSRRVLGKYRTELMI